MFRPLQIFGPVEISVNEAVSGRSVGIRDTRVLRASKTNLLNTEDPAIIFIYIDRLHLVHNIGTNIVA